MKKKLWIAIPAVLVIAGIVLAVCLSGPKTCEATYLGVKGYGTVTRGEVLAPDSQVYRFSVNGREKCYRIESGLVYADSVTEVEKKGDTDFYDVLPAEDGAYPIQNMLFEGDAYRLTVRGKKIVACEPIGQYGIFKPLIEGTPGKLTLKNFLQTALMPVGNVLYVYGGGWDWQDVGASGQARTIGLSEVWTNAFAQADAGYRYKDEEHRSETTYPFESWNQYYYLGLDCSAYLGWTLYNTFYTESLAHPGLVGYASRTARTVAEDFGMGTLNHTETRLRPGDIISTKGHTWICLGCCADGSVVGLESNILNSRTGALGGGVQIFAASAKGEDDIVCEAYRLAEEYMAKYYPQWTQRYPICVRELAHCTDFPDDSASTGVCHWTILPGENGSLTAAEKGLADPEGLSAMNAAEILKELFAD